jgi:hypothetical protein
MAQAQKQSIQAVKMSVAEAVSKAMSIAAETTQRYHDVVLRGHDSIPCGFAWIQVMVRGNTRLGKELLKLGFEKHEYKKGLTFWNPSKSRLQNVDAKAAGAEDAARFLTEVLGVEVIADNQWD